MYNDWERWHESTLPHLQNGQLFTPTSVLMDQGETRPPPLLSESDLIKVSLLGRQVGRLGVVA